MNLERSLKPIATIAAVGAAVVCLTKVVLGRRKRDRTAFTADRQTDEIAHLEDTATPIREAAVAPPDESR